MTMVVTRRAGGSATRPAAETTGPPTFVGILWPPGHAPLLAAVYYTGSSAPREQLDAVHAEIGRILGAAF